jgi:hypothetical protein
MPTFLFILSPPYAGSTVLWQLLQTSPHVSALPTEGQYLGPVKQLMTGSAGGAARELPWAQIREEWSKHWDFTKPLLLDKSTRNLSHAKEIEEVFVPASFIAMMRDPYALCEGLARRRNRRNRLLQSQPGASPESHSEVEAMGIAAARWRRYAERQAQNIRELERTLCVTYEDLTDRTPDTLTRIMEFLPELGQLDATRKFLVHSVTGTDRRALTNMNGTKWQCLRKADVEAINGVLGGCRDVLEFFGYALKDPDRFQDLRAVMTRSVSLVLKLKNEGREALMGRKLATTGRSRWRRWFRTADARSGKSRLSGAPPP